MYSFHRISVMPELPKRIAKLSVVARNLWFSWHPQAQDLFRKVDIHLWEEVYHNPVKFLLYVDIKKLDAASQNPEYLAMYDQVVQDLDLYMKKKTWYQEHYPQASDKLIAYFSAEFGLHESVPVYSGGLGLLAGDHCKSASDLGIPLIGVGMLYKQGYFFQKMNAEGRQEDHYSLMDFNQMPITPAVHKNGGDVIIPVEFPGRIVYVKVWQLQVGRIMIYFLDADVPQNNTEDRLLTSRLYGGDRATRISQEIILGIGGVRALRELGIAPNTWHINEGHAAFTIIERTRELIRDGISFPVACEVVRSNTIFTTHTPVPAGHDVFDPQMVDQYFGHLYDKIGIDRNSFMSLGWDHDRQGFNMTKLALKHSCYTNGVSKLHTQVSKQMFSQMYNHIPLDEVPISSITNGVHTETWVAPEMRHLFEKYLGQNWNEHIVDQTQWQQVHNIPDQELWETHQLLKTRMIKFVQNNLRNRMERNFRPAKLIEESIGQLDKDVFIIGFARRFATYKRANLLLQDKVRLARILNNPEMPVRIIFAGKAHPADSPGQQLIKQICDLEKDPQFRGKILFAENYDINMSRHLLQGVDMWLNTPRRPLEASGTSGQKAAVNGVINCSTLDGWWPEFYTGKNGFTVGSDKEYPNDDIHDSHDARSLFNLLEHVILPCYYHKNNGLPVEWIKLMKESLATTPWQFSSERMVQEYCTEFYLSASQREKNFTEDKYKLATQIQNYKQSLSDNWHHIHFKSIRVKYPQSLRAGDKFFIESEIFLGQFKPQDVSVEVVYGQVKDQSLDDITLIPMTLNQNTGIGFYKYTSNVSLVPGASGYALRIRPNNEHFTHPFELPLIKWADLK